MNLSICPGNDLACPNIVINEEDAGVIETGNPPSDDGGSSSSDESWTKTRATLVLGIAGNDQREERSNSEVASDHACKS